MLGRGSGALAGVLWLIPDDGGGGRPLHRGGIFRWPSGLQLGRCGGYRQIVEGISEKTNEDGVVVDGCILRCRRSFVPAWECKVT